MNGRLRLAAVPLVALAVTFTFTLAAGPAPAAAEAEAARGGTGALDLRQLVVEHRLANGLKLLLVRRPAAPVFTAYVRVRAGGADERPGKTGLAHLLEHLAYKGTAVVGSRSWAEEEPLLLEIARRGDELAALAPGAGEADALRARLTELSQKARSLQKENALTEILMRHGASNLNAETDKDTTTFYVSLPKNRLELWALLEASRLAAPVPRDFYAERAVVQEERRDRVESDPVGMLLEELDLVAFTDSPYRWPTIGYAADLQSLSMRDALQFHRDHYVPANTIVSIVGDIDLEATRAIAERTFGAIPARAPPPRRTFVEPPRRSERRATVFFDAAPHLAVAFLKPTVPDRDDYVFDVIQLMMTEGRTSRLYRALVTDRALCSEVSGAMTPGARLPHLYAVIAAPLAGARLEDVEAAILGELERLKAEGPTPAELSRVRARLDADFSRQLATNAGLAETLSFFEAIAGDWRYLADHRRQIASITADDVRQVARRYFVPENRTVIHLKRPAWADPAGTGQGEEDGR